ncbi:hypothetical protein TH61_07370 [Rufibacter sp. DG15C]|nr:hypothetical protein TH61_07370 [Rufibacter sp. DG15C]
MKGQPVKLAPRARRIIAFLIDHFVITSLLVALTFLGIGPDFLNERPDISTLLSLVLVPGFILYFLKDSIKGRSLGKWSMGLMIRKNHDTTEVPSLGSLFVRNLFLIIWPIEALVLLASQGKRRIGDRVTNSVVLIDPEKPAQWKRMLPLIGACFAFCFFILMFVGVAIKSSDAYKTAIDGIEQDKELQKETGGIIGYGWMPSGNISIKNGYGEGQLQIHVKGKERDVNVQVYLTKDANHGWEVEEIEN